MRQDKRRTRRKRDHNRIGRLSSARNSRNRALCWLLSSSGAKMNTVYPSEELMFRVDDERSQHSRLVFACIRLTILCFQPCSRASRVRDGVRNRRALDPSAAISSWRPKSVSSHLTLPRLGQTCILLKKSRHPKRKDGTAYYAHTTPVTDLCNAC